MAMKIRIMKDLDKNYTEAIKDVKIYDKETLKKMIKEYYKTQDKTLLNNIVMSLQPLIISIVNDYFTEDKKFRLTHRVEPADLVQQGNLNIVDILQRKLYDVNKGIAPSTYFTNSMHNFIGKYIFETQGDFKGSVTADAKRRAIKEYNEDIANGMSEKKALRKNNLTKKDFVKYPERYTTSMHEIIYDEDGNETEFGDLIPDKNMKTPEEETINKELYEILRRNTSELEFNLLIDRSKEYKPAEMAVKYKISEAEVKTILNQVDERLQKNEELLSYYKGETDED